MKRILNLALAMALISTLIVACQSPAEEANSETPPAEQPEKTTESVVTATTVFNANLATEADLNSIGLAAELITKIMEARPFLSMNDLDALLGY
jgi:DNA uptake protein ComE-like DNA-binding protein